MAHRRRRLIHATDCTYAAIDNSMDDVAETLRRVMLATPEAYPAATDEMPR